MARFLPFGPALHAAPAFRTSKFFAASGVPSFADHQMWSWFNDPHILYQYTGSKNWLHIGWCNELEAAGVTSVNLKTGVATETVLHTWPGSDDHNPVQLLAMPDGKLFASYSPHGNDLVYVNKTTDSADPTSWGTEFAASTQSGTYPKPVRFRSGRMVIIHRGIFLTPVYMISDDDGASWSSELGLIAGTRPYVNLHYDPITDLVDILYTNGHPNLLPDTSLFHVTLDSDGNVRKTDGTFIKNVFVDDAAFNDFDGTRIYEFSDSSGSCWGWDICRDVSDKTKINAVFARFPRTDDHRYCYARWDGSAWTVDYDIMNGTAGHSFYEAPGFGPASTEKQYSGGVQLSRTDPSRVFVSRQTGSSHEWEIERWDQTTSGVRSLRDEILTDRPAGYWRFEEASGTEAYDQIGNYHGLHINSPTLGVSGVTGSSSAVQYTAASSQETTMNGPVLSTDATVMYWFKWASSALFALLRDNAGNWIMGFDSGTFLQVRFGDATTRSTGVSTASLQDGNWHHFALVKEGATGFVMVDGVEGLTVASGLSNTASLMPWHVARNGTIAQYTSATIDELVMYPHALSRQRVLAHREAGLAVLQEPKFLKGAQVTQNSGKNIRPSAPRYPEELHGTGAPEMIWLRGRYDNFVDYDMDAVTEPFTFVPAAGVWLGRKETTSSALSVDVDKRVTVVPATTTSAAQALTFTKTIRKTLGVASETDAAQALSYVKPILKTLGVVTSTATSQALDVDKHVTLGVASSAATAQTLSVTKTIFKTLGVASTTSSAQAVDVDKRVTLGVGTETGSARPLTVTKTIFKTVGVVSETDSARPVDADKHVTVATGAETDSARTLTATKTIFKALGVASETDTSQALDVDKRRGITTGTETDTAQAVSFSQASSHSISPASETDAAQAVDADKHVTISRGSEADSANTLAAGANSYSIGVASTTSSAEQAVPSMALVKTALGGWYLGQSPFGGISAYNAPPTTQFKSILPATEADRANVLLRPGLETDSARPFDADKKRSLTPVGDTSSADAPTVRHSVTIGVAFETDSAQAQHQAHLFSITLVTSTNAARPLTAAHLLQILQASEADTAQLLHLTRNLYGAGFGPALETDLAHSLDSTLHIVSRTDRPSANVLTDYRSELVLAGG